MKRDRKIFIRSTVSDSMDFLILMSFKAYSNGDLDLSRRYMSEVHKLSSAYKVKLSYRRAAFCQRCHIPWISGETMDTIPSRSNPDELVRIACKCGYKRTVKKSWLKKIKEVKEQSKRI